MTQSKKLISSLNPLIETRDDAQLKERTGNIYKSIVIMSKRANRINTELKDELHRKLQDFANHTDSLEEIQENKEQIEISRFYERMANPSLRAMDEFLTNKISFLKKEEMDSED